MTFNGKLFGGWHKTRRNQVMSDGRIKFKDTALELWGDTLLHELGYEPIKDKKGNTPKVPIPKEWVHEKYDHGVTLEPDRMVQVRVGEPLKVLLFDGWHEHNRTLKQELRDDRHDRWYNRAGYYVIHIGDFWASSKKKTEELKPLLATALRSREWVVDLAR